VVGEGEEDASLAGYRAGTTAVAHDATGESAGEPVAEYGRDEEPGVASGMAGGAPIQEYTPGSGPDFTPPADEETKPDHETAPWPPYGTSQGSVLGESSLGGRDEERTDPDRHTDQNTEKGNDSDR
jgi:hypothetical protein